jgi:diguanylate cyclase
VSGKFLNEVLGHSEHVQELIEQSSRTLSLANAGSTQEPVISDAIPGEGAVLGVNDAVTRQLQDASRALLEVIQLVRIEIKDRTMVDHQLAAAIEQEEGSRNAALHDHLTGLPNRVLFVDRLQHGIAQAKRHRWILAVIFVDLDNFKFVNDTYGHHAGDVILQTVATRLRHGTRDADTVSRYGGDEFLYLLNQLRDENDIAMIVGKILRAIQTPCNLIVQDVTASPCMKASIGIAVFPRDGATPSALIKCADEAMYVAKQNKSGFAFAHSEVSASSPVSQGHVIVGGTPSIDAS